MKLLLYEILTQVIVIVGRIREIFEPVMYLRGDRICGMDKKTYPENVIEAKGVKVFSVRCCDCGAWHYFWVESDIFFGMAIRPEKYQYRLRILGCRASLATDKMLEKMTAVEREVR